MSALSDVAVIGGGLAGLAAARALADQGIEVALFEASERLGGRVQTITDGGLAVELGPEFVHGKVDATRALAREAGVELDPLADRHVMRRDGELVELSDMWERFGGLVEGAGGAGHGSADESARAYLARARLSREDAQLYAMLVEGFYAAPLDDISVAGIAADQSGPGGEEAAQYRVRGGYGRLVDHLANRLERTDVMVHRGCVVHAIEWGGDRVEVAFRTHGNAEGFASARRAIVTLPIGVLQAGSVTFTPALGDHAAAIGRLAMGQVVKVVLEVRDRVWPARTEFVHADDTAFPTFWVRSEADAHQLVAWAGGPHATALAHYSTAELVDRVVDGFARALALSRPRLASAIVRAHHHDYRGDPFARGAYSYTRVGGTTAPRLLAQPLRATLYLAGEATDPELEGTVAGALASGMRAAAQVVVARR